MARKPLSGWCGSLNHGRCPHLMQIARQSPKGRNIPQLFCSCRCHKETRSSES